MPKLDAVRGPGPDLIQLTSMPWLERSVAPGLIRGGV